MDARHALFLSDLSGSAAEVNRRALQVTADFDVLEREGAVDAGAECFGEGFFGGEEAGGRSMGIVVPLHKRNLRGGEELAEETATGLGNRLGDASDVGEVDSEAEEHG